MRTRLLVFCLAAMAALAAVPASAGAAYVEEVYIPMDDGKKLAATIGYPADPKTTSAKWPAILTMTPYSKDLSAPSNTYLSRGYVHAVVDIRGAGASEGNLNDNYFSPREQRDGHNLVEWLGTQSWSSGNVGMMGGSYLGITQYLTAIQQPSHLKAIVPAVALEDLYRDATYHGGILSQFFGAQYLAVQGGPGLLSGPQEATDQEKAFQVKLEQIQSKPIAFDYLANTTDTEFHRVRSPGHRADKIQVPTLIYDGWFDGFLRGATEMYPKLADRKGVETQLWLDPTTHKGARSSLTSVPSYNPMGYPADKLHSFTNRTIEFFNRHLKGQQTPDRKPVKAFIMGRDQYIEDDRWPPEDVSYRRLYLKPGGFSDTPAPTGESSFPTNPADGFTTTLSRHGNMAASPYLPLDQSLESKQGLIWETQALDEPLALAGPMALDIVATSTAPDTDWIVRVSNVAPDGTVGLLSEGYLRASHRKLDYSKTRPERPYHPHLAPTPTEILKAEPYEIEVWPTGMEFQKGSRLRVQLTSNDTPNHTPGTITLDPVDPFKIELKPHLPALNSVKYGGADGSSVVLPVLGLPPVGLLGRDAYDTPFRQVAGAPKPPAAPPGERDEPAVPQSPLVSGQRVSGSPGRALAKKRRTVGCKAGRRARVTSRGVGRFRIGARSKQPGRRIGWCVKRGKGFVVARVKGGRAVLVVSTARGHSADGVRPGSSLAKLRREFPGARRVSGGWWATGPSTRLVFRVRRGRVKAVGAVSKKLLFRRGALRRELRRLGV